MFYGSVYFGQFKCFWWCCLIIIEFSHWSLGLPLVLTFIMIIEILHPSVALYVPFFVSTSDGVPYTRSACNNPMAAKNGNIFLALDAAVVALHGVVMLLIALFFLVSIFIQS
ncbi:hypothetical protein RJT34_25118 [Clitoria ternatea]|uniref:Uncharacterized protein n=1 Tax=Clitoria ternatea TaxID=43366 RepID=A0AAN9FRY4_CLITE